MNYEKKYKKYKMKYLELKNQIGGNNNQLPRSLFQLMKLFINLPFEVSIEVNKDTNGTINLFLTKGYETHTDYLHESQSICGIHIHTHPYNSQRDKTMKYWPPTNQDIIHSIRNIMSKKFITENKLSLHELTIPENPIKKYDYVFDGNALWYYKPNINLIKEFLDLEIRYDPKMRLLLEVIWNNSGNIGGDLNGLRKEWGYPKITLEQYIEKMTDLLEQNSLGKPNDKILCYDIGLIEWKKQKSIIIPDNISCNINERRDKHIILPESDILGKEELEILFNKALKIFENQDKLRKGKVNYESII